MPIQNGETPKAVFKKWWLGTDGTYFGLFLESPWPFVMAWTCFGFSSFISVDNTVAPGQCIIFTCLANMNLIYHKERKDIQFPCLFFRCPGHRHAHRLHHSGCRCWNSNPAKSLRGQHGRQEQVLAAICRGM